MNLRNLTAAMVAQSPSLLVQCDLAEALYCSTDGCMLDDPSDFVEGKACVPGQ